MARLPDRLRQSSGGRSLVRTRTDSCDCRDRRIPSRPMPTWQILVGDARERLRELPERSVQTCVTSPPYFGLRDYGTGEWEGGDPDHEHDRVGARGGRGGSGTLDKRNGEAMA